MRELDDAALELRLRGVLKEHLGTLPFDLTVDALDSRREARGVARQRRRGRGMTLLAAAALLLVGGALAGTGILRLPSVVPPAPAPSLGLVATASPDTTSPGPSDLPGPSASPLPAAGPGGAWVATGTMGTPRIGLSAVRLLDGRVLVVGGSGDESDPATAELYDPASGTWSATGTMLKRPEGIPPTLLLDGRVLVGDSDDPDPATEGDEIAGAEVYDPVSGTWSATGPMVRGANYVRDIATVLQDGRVLVAGLKGAQIYDPASGAWSATANMTIPRYYASATLLPDGRVIVAGGWVWPAGRPESRDASAELFDPDTGSWTVIASMHTDQEPMASLLQPDGTVLVVGSSSVEVYDPATGTWTELAEGRGGTATPLSDGTVLVTGLSGPDCPAPALFDPRTGSWTTASSMHCANGSSFTLLIDGTVLAAGGEVCNDSDVCVPTGAAELYVPAGVSPPSLSALPSPPPLVFPSPTPVPTPFPAAAGPVPPNARSWKVTVDNERSEPATLFVADDLGAFRLVGSATPNVVPAGATVTVTFLFPAEGGPDDGWIFVNPAPGEGGSLVSAADIGIPGKIVITPDGQTTWLSPPGY